MRADARLILIVEKEGIFARLAEDHFFETIPGGAILVTGEIARAVGRSGPRLRWGASVAPLFHPPAPCGVLMAVGDSCAVGWTRAPTIIGHCAPLRATMLRPTRDVLPPTSATLCSLACARRCSAQQPTMMSHTRQRPVLSSILTTCDERRRARNNDDHHAPLAPTTTTESPLAPMTATEPYPLPSPGKDDTHATTKTAALLSPQRLRPSSSRTNDRS